MKARGVEHVRHRMVVMPTDMLAESKIARMRKAAADAAEARRCPGEPVPDTWVVFCDRGAGWQEGQVPGSASTTPPATRPHEFVEQAHARSLRVIDLKGSDAEALLVLYAKLLSQLPARTRSFSRASSGRNKAAARRSSTW